MSFHFMSRQLAVLRDVLSAQSPIRPAVLLDRAWPLAAAQSCLCMHVAKILFRAGVPALCRIPGETRHADVDITALETWSVSL